MPVQELSHGFRVMHAFVTPREKGTTPSGICDQIVNTGELVGNPDFTSGNFTMSGITEADKFTKQAERCLAIVLNGDLPDGKPVSMVVHATPEAFHRFSNFTYHYNLALAEFSQQTVAGSRLAVVTGGYHEPFPFNIYSNPFDRRRYFHAVHHLSALHKEKLDCPTYATKPKNALSRHATQTDAYLQTGARTLFVVESKKRGDGKFKPAQLRRVLSKRFFVS